LQSSRRSACLKQMPEYGADATLIASAAPADSSTAQTIIFIQEPPSESAACVEHRSSRVAAPLVAAPSSASRGARAERWGSHPIAPGTAAGQSGSEIGFRTPTSVVFQREPFMDRSNFATRAARWSAEHWKTAVAVWGSKEAMMATNAPVVPHAASPHDAAPKAPDDGSDAPSTRLRGHIGWAVAASLVSGLAVGLLLVAAPFISAE
jgi:hypothetical protein